MLYSIFMRGYLKCWVPILGRQPSQLLWDPRLSSHILTCDHTQNRTTMVPFKNAIIPLNVIGINTSSHIMRISQDILFKRCFLHDVGAVNLLSNLKPDMIKNIIKLYYGCVNCNSIYYHSNSFKCSYYAGTSTAYYFDKPSDMSRINESCSCKNNVTFPVDKRVVDELKRTNHSASIWSLLRKWPANEVVYLANFTACSKCEKSGGRCGSSVDPPSDQFVCYCLENNGAHRAQPLVCHRKSGGGMKLLLVSGATIVVIGTLILVLLIICAKKRQTTNKFSNLLNMRTMRDQEDVATFLKSYGSLAPKRYTYANIKKMTNFFKDKLGEGGYGTVYKGKLHDGRFVAVKKLKILEGDGKDFINEVLSISMRTNHVNVVTLLGFCFEGNKRALIFEFLPNGSLEKFICGRQIGPSLQWEIVFDIAIGIAKGLDYLHRGCNTRILHFDIKPHNILLDEEFRPKISDFGLAKLCLPKKSMISMSEARGTIGYIAPEVFCRNFGGVSHKSDVYSYGMMLIDLVCGRKNIANDDEHSCEMYFPEWIYNRLENLEEDVVHEIMTNENKELERKMILVSLWCIQTYPSNRPPMNKVVEMLEGSVESLQMPPKPNLSSPARSFVCDSSL
ncbi:LOW QUALITY PROTEIN: LEAF RUST 10 DISEASE-RESISTANCE LOCUS RECEPTOR-LIKE PROTEIN KINASE-like 2.5 [Beta vulgaris subsp. vulgaris]|uniref:LOW QUALITY PROTEIN: LEAF RUST 10 DISEASE-RESISTANCE LOCUS RECEPTOR-LIKE PROTEIN KINASE-like 2.5 n=1 Tax=Beta vulgaris subsp. vulgaris TaxID=3555 RepID=UPI0020375A62|nr:LOW QUALITY PROTEIN: LEAF RUST 10 DISEASE-RESISTANCE LOCUS RECEPTOR-LIKE PROTEIN KINASE-like 2.5 [Beta vulgaris subsp. vulgaris]